MEGRWGKQLWAPPLEIGRGGHKPGVVPLEVRSTRKCSGLFCIVDSSGSCFKMALFTSDLSKRKRHLLVPFLVVSHHFGMTSAAAGSYVPRSEHED